MYIHITSSNNKVIMIFKNPTKNAICTHTQEYFIQNYRILLGNYLVPFNCSMRLIYLNHRKDIATGWWKIPQVCAFVYLSLNLLLSLNNDAQNDKMLLILHTDFRKQNSILLMKDFLPLQARCLKHLHGGPCCFLWSAAFQGAQISRMSEIVPSNTDKADCPQFKHSLLYVFH